MNALIRKIGMTEPTAKPSPRNIVVPMNIWFTATNTSWIDRISRITRSAIKRKRTISLDGLLWK